MVPRKTWVSENLAQSREGLQESICSELTGTAYWTELVIRFKDSKTRQRSIHLYWWVSAGIFGHFILLYLYYYLEIFGALSLGLGFFRSKVLGSKLIKALKSRSRILKPGSRSLVKSQIFHSISLT